MPEETLREANTCIVNHDHGLDLSKVFGGGTMSSSDGQRFPELTRFGGHLISGEPWFPEEGVCCAEQLSAGVSSADGGAGARGTDAGGTGQGVPALRAVDPYGVDAGADPAVSGGGQEASAVRLVSADHASRATTRGGVRAALEGRRSRRGIRAYRLAVGAVGGADSRGQAQDRCLDAHHRAADTYTSVFPQVAMAAAEKTAALLLGDGEEGRGVLRQLRV